VGNNLSIARVGPLAPRPAFSGAREVKVRAGLLLSCLVLVSCLPLGVRGDALVREPDYPLDDVSRAVTAGEKLPCQLGQVELVSHRGELVRYDRPVRVHPAFREHLLAFEALVDEVARVHFGRAPRRILHFGTYACRPMRNHGHWMSEHALGNAIDVAGFDFAPLPRKLTLPDTATPALRRGFQVRVDKHWNATGTAAPQAAFLRDLAQRLIAQPELFRAIVGPDFPGHHNHFHLGHPPYRMVKLGDTVRWYW
jgi:hypothetical protein